MRGKFTTFILFLIVVILILGIIILGGAIYLDLTGSSNQITYKIESIATEKPEKDESTENTSQETNESILSIISNTSTNKTTTISEDDSINKFFYSQLSSTQAIIYDKLSEEKENLKQGNYVINYGDAFSDILSEENGSDQLGDDYQTAIEAFMHDNPDLFYIDVNKMYLNIETTTKFLSTTYNVYISAASGSTYLSDEFTSTSQINMAIKAVEAVRDEVVNSLSGSDYNKILEIHDYLIDNVEYDSTYQAAGTYGIYGALVEKVCVCEGYAKAFKYLCNSAGIECEIMQGTATNSSGTTESHAWNCVKVNGTWYEMDVTWDDPLIVGNGTISDTVKYRYFLKGTITFDRDHVLSYQFSDGGKYFDYPKISEEDY